MDSSGVLVIRRCRRAGRCRALSARPRWFSSSLWYARELAVLLELLEDRGIDPVRVVGKQFQAAHIDLHVSTLRSNQGARLEQVAGECPTERSWTRCSPLGSTSSRSSGVNPSCSATGSTNERQCRVFSSARVLRLGTMNVWNSGTATPLRSPLLCFARRYSVTPVVRAPCAGMLGDAQQPPSPSPQPLLLRRVRTSARPNGSARRRALASRLGGSH